jgi:hypothetical protein
MSRKTRPLKCPMRVWRTDPKRHSIQQKHVDSKASIALARLRDHREIQRPLLIDKVDAQQRSRGVASHEVMPSSEDLKDVRGARVSNPPSVVDILRE